MLAGLRALIEIRKARGLRANGGCDGQGQDKEESVQDHGWLSDGCGCNLELPVRGVSFTKRRNTFTLRVEFAKAFSHSFLVTGENVGQVCNLPDDSECARRGGRHSCRRPPLPYPLPSAQVHRFKEQRHSCRRVQDFWNA